MREPFATIELQSRVGLGYRAGCRCWHEKKRDKKEKKRKEENKSPKAISKLTEMG